VTVGYSSVTLLADSTGPSFFRLDRVVLASGSLGFIAAHSTLSSNAPACRTTRAQPTLQQVPVDSLPSQAGGQPGPDQMPRPRSSCPFKPRPAGR
jgi:hypothetical protein